ncbi:hypothetical protein PIB30_022236 [Stylosanthes scabra]|uniref:Uncharacterized protein n=1 Tax=Stylosanthes scabra TaxID=79078 RepID=A0ABU6Q8V4_9FABA|nr:hypothetical protein [Stylosanthes scabra]
MALLGSSHLNNKNCLIPLADKLDENNHSTWTKSVLLTIRTLKLQDHLFHDKTPPQFEDISSSKVDAESTAKKSDGGAESSVINKKDPSFTPKNLQESEKYLEWA